MFCDMMANIPKWQHGECRVTTKVTTPDDTLMTHVQTKPILTILMTSVDYLWWSVWWTDDNPENYMTASDDIWLLEKAIYITKVDICLSCQWILSAVSSQESEHDYLIIMSVQCWQTQSCLTLNETPKQHGLYMNNAFMGKIFNH